MSKLDRERSKGESPLPRTGWSGPSEPESHTEHQAALAATLFRSASDPFELVLELDSGELRLRPESPADSSED